MSLKYPKTLHFSFSENLQNDDRMLPNDNIFVGREVVVTCKLDGENSGLSNRHCHARSLDGLDHDSRHWLKGLHVQIARDIPENWEVFGENMYAFHSIFYDKLTTFFYVFGIVNEKKMFLSWDDMVEFSHLLGLETVPLLYRGIWDENKVKACFPNCNVFAAEQEGYVVRTADAFHYDEFENNVGKFVRKGHVKTDEHWLKTWIPNRLYQ